MKDLTIYIYKFEAAIGFASRLNPMTKIPFGDTRIFLSLKITIVSAVVSPITRPPWVKWPLSVRASAAQEKNKMGHTQLIIRFKAALLGARRD